jgi:hypothetical protein
MAYYTARVNLNGFTSEQKISANSTNEARRIAASLYGESNLRGVYDWEQSTDGLREASDAHSRENAARYAASQEARIRNEREYDERLKRESREREEKIYRAKMADDQEKLIGLMEENNRISSQNSSISGGGGGGAGSLDMREEESRKLALIFFAVCGLSTISGMIYGLFTDVGVLTGGLAGGLAGAMLVFNAPFFLLMLLIGFIEFVCNHIGGIIGTIVVSTILIAMALDFYNDWIKNKRKDDQDRNLLIKAYVHTLGYADDKVWFKVATFTLRQKKITNDILKKKFRLDDKYVHALVNLMEDEGMISEANANGERLVLKKFEV